jgi:hypothetical protein
MHGLEAFALDKSILQSLDFTVNCFFFMKPFKTSAMKIVTECQQIFMFKLHSVMFADRIYNQQTKIDSILPLYFNCFAGHDDLCMYAVNLVAL